MPSKKPGSRRISRIVYGAFTLFLAVFVASNVVQVARRVFGEADDVARVDGPCAAAIENEMRAIDAARMAATTELGAEEARTRYARERRSVTPASAICKDQDEALAALARFDRASEALAIRTSSELRPVRLAAQSFIRSPR
jgi:hypothetical protein